MRKVIYDRQGDPRLYLTGAGVLYTLDNTPVAVLHDEQVTTSRGEPRAFFDGALLWDLAGCLLGFVKGAQPPAGLTLPKTTPLTLKPAPQPALFVPFVRHAPRADPTPVWSDEDVNALFVRQLA